MYTQIEKQILALKFPSTFVNNPQFLEYMADIIERTLGTKKENYTLEKTEDGRIKFQDKNGNFVNISIMPSKDVIKIKTFKEQSNGEKKAEDIVLESNNNMLISRKTTADTIMDDSKKNYKIAIYDENMFFSSYGTLDRTESILYQNITPSEDSKLEKIFFGSLMTLARVGRKKVVNSKVIARISDIPTACRVINSIDTENGLMQIKDEIFSLKSDYGFSKLRPDAFKTRHKDIMDKEKLKAFLLSNKYLTTSEYIKNFINRTQNAKTRDLLMKHFCEYRMQENETSRMKM